MKKYEYLKENEILRSGDERKTMNGWEPIEDSWVGTRVRYSEMVLESTRRPIPITGKTAFLVNYSPTIRVEVDCTGLSEEEIYEKVAGAAQFKFFTTASEYREFFHENIDWRNTKVDEECPAEQPTKYRYLAIGEEIEADDEIFSVMEADFMPISNGYEWMVGSKFSRAKNQIRRKV